MEVFLVGFLMILALFLLVLREKCRQRRRERIKNSKWTKEKDTAE